MRDVAINGYILHSPGGVAYVFCSTEMTEYGYTTICPHVLRFTLPDGFDLPKVPELIDRLTEVQ